MAKKSVRNMKVYGQSGYQYKTIPSIMLKGQWLKDWGFEIDDAIVVKCEDGKLVISKAEADEEQAITGVSQMVAEGVKKYGS